MSSLAIQLPDPLPKLPEIPSADIRKQVFAHSTSLTFSAAELKSPPQSNERLEFLGDSYLNFCVTNIVFREFPTLAPGELTALRAGVVSNANLKTWARAYNLHEQLVLGLSMQHLQIPEKAEKVIADVFEAYIGGVILSNPDGRKEIEEFLEGLLQPVLEMRRKTLKGAVKVDKTSVGRMYEEAILRKRKASFAFGDSGCQGAEDRWEAILEWDGKEVGRAKARNQQEAKHRASALALKSLDDGELGK